MLSIYQLKTRFQKFLRPLVSLLAEKRISANEVTILAVIISAGEGYLMYANPDNKFPFLLLPIILFIRMALNAIDGMLAREFGMKSDLGAILNELGDVISDTALYLPFALVNGVNSMLIVAICLFSIICEMTGVLAINIGAHRRYDGPMGKSDRAFVFGLTGILLGMNIINSAILNTAFLITLLLLVITIFNRAKNALKEVAFYE